MPKYKKILNNKNAIEIDGKVVLSFDPKYKEYLKWRDENPKLENKLLQLLEFEKLNKFLYAGGEPHIKKIGKKAFEYEWYFENGTKKFETGVANDVFHGHSISWDEKGRKVHEGKFKNGKRIGKWTFYNEDGSIENGNYVDNKFYTIKKEIIPSKGKVLTKVVELHSTATDVKERKVTYWKSSVKKSEIGLTSGTSLSFHDVRSKNGNCIHYWQNGKVMCKGKYFKNEMHGKWTWYFENGNLQSTINYKFGEKAGLFELYYKNRNVKIRGNYKNNLKNGMWLINGKKRKYKYGKEL